MLAMNERTIRGQAAENPLSASRFADLDVQPLNSWLQANVAGFRSLECATKFAGGQSNPTYRIEDGERSFVLRRKPFGPLLPSAHAVDREYRLIGALHGTDVPVAKAYALCTDDSVIGSEFYVMDMVEGRTFWDGSLPDLSKDQRRPIYDEMIAVLAKLHNVDLNAIGLDDFGAPGNYFERQVRRWTKQYRAAQTDDIEEMEKLIDWLARTIPRQERTSVIHGDYRIDNMIFAPDGPRVLAILDWELATIGDPLADFAYLAMNWAMPAGARPSQLGGLDLAALCIPTLDEATALYCELTDRTSLPDLHWHFAYCLFRLAAIVQGIKKRAVDGNASNAEAVQSGSRVPGIAAQAWALARQAGAT